MKKLGIVFAVMALFFLTGCNLTMVEEDQELSLSASELQSVKMDLDEGEIDIIGENREDIKVVATFASRSEEVELAQRFQEENMSISLEQIGNEAYLLTNIYRGDRSTVEARIHIKAYIPKDLKVKINHDGGNLRLEDLSNSIELNHSAGKLSLENITGNISIIDGTGAIELMNSKGNISINNNFGAIRIIENTGDIKLISGSGEINIQSIKGMIEIRSGSGSINIDQVDGDVTILENRSGKVGITNVSGTVINE